MTGLGGGNDGLGVENDGLKGREDKGRSPVFQKGTSSRAPTGHAGPCWGRFRSKVVKPCPYRNDALWDKGLISTHKPSAGYLFCRVSWLRPLLVQVHFCPLPTPGEPVTAPILPFRHPRGSGDPWSPPQFLDSHFRGNDKGAGMTRGASGNDGFGIGNDGLGGGEDKGRSPVFQEGTSSRAPTGHTRPRWGRSRPTVVKPCPYGNGSL